MARQLLDDTLPKEMTLESLFAGLNNINQRLQARLVPLLGSMAMRMVMARAIRQAAPNYPFLHNITFYEDGVETDDLLLEKSDADYAEVREGLEALLAAFLQQMAGLIGKDLTTRLVLEPIGGPDPKAYPKSSAKGESNG